MRFVVLRHEVGSSLQRSDEDHLDWMWQRPKSHALWTWCTPVINIQRPLTTHATRLPDHRVAYLDHEGPIGGNRGRVIRVATGEFEVVTADEQEFSVRITRSDRDNLIVGDRVVIQRRRVGLDEPADSELRVE